ncbi:MAG TPA: Hpt domain-containing protein, partial [Pirellulaceae bacterium]|nr:Hpt domain-containing protein [Pirellulaceae bacterium]
MSGGGGDPVPNALLEVFRDEVRSSSGALAQGLVALEQAPRDLSRIEPLMRAAHSIKGAARIVRIDHAVRLAHAMEDLLVAAQQSRVTLEAAHIDMLLAGADRLLELALATDEDFEQWMSEHQAILDELIARHVAAADPTARQVARPAVSAATGSAPNEPSVSKAIVAVESTSAAGSRSAAGSKSAAESPVATPPQSDTSPPFENWRPADEPALLELFREELRSQCADFMVALAPLDRSSSQERAAPDPARFEPLLRAAHSIKGAAKIVQVVPAVVLADAVHGLLSALQDGRVIPQTSQLELLREAVERLKEVGELAPDRLVAWFKELDVRLRGLVARLTAAARDTGRRDTVVGASDTPSAPASSSAGALATSISPAASGAPTPLANEPAETAESVEPELLELFREEVANGCAALAEGLLSVEQKPGDAQAFEPLMRAAHSIKGAGRIVNRSVVVALSHAMEDCLVAAQHGRLRITAAEIDLLLAGTDLLQRMGKDGVDSSPEIREAADELVRQLKGVLTGQPPAPSRAVAAEASTPASSLDAVLAAPSKPDSAGVSVGAAAVGVASAAPTEIASAAAVPTSPVAPINAPATPTTPPVAPIGRRSPAGLAPPPQSPAAAAA